MADFLNLLQDLANSGVLDLWPYFLIIYTLTLYLALIIWVLNDVLKRSHSFLFQILAVCLIVFGNIFGLIVYLIIRPRQTLLELNLYETELKTLISTHSCPQCQTELTADFLYCPFCQIQIQNRCSKCHSIFKKEWEMCPFCGHSSVNSPKSSPKRTRSKTPKKTKKSTTKRSSRK